MPSVKLNLGCGSNTPDGWINIDGSWNARLAKYPSIRIIMKYLSIIPNKVAEIDWNKDILVHDVRRKLPFDDEAVDAIYCSHLLEHLYFEEAKSLLLNCYKVLKNNGVLRLVVPDLKSIIYEYLNDNNNINEPKADRLNRKMQLRYERASKGSFIYNLYSLATDYHSHKWMYDTDSLIYHVKSAGFRQAKECKFLESSIQDINVIEKAERVLNGVGICIEGIK